MRHLPPLLRAAALRLTRYSVGRSYPTASRRMEPTWLPPLVDALGHPPVLLSRRGESNP
jgi:hypothetical protein